jgi:hypothetical protein
VLFCCFKADARLRIQNQILESANATDFQNFFPYLSSRTRRLGKQHNMSSSTMGKSDKEMDPSESFEFLLQEASIL